MFKIFIQIFRNSRNFFDRIQNTGFGIANKGDFGSVRTGSDAENTKNSSS